MGDSLMRYQYLSLVDAIERGGNPLGERMRVGTDSVQRLKYGKGRGDVLRGDAFRVWNDFYEKTSKGLHGHEFCDCVRHPFKLYPPPIIENRYYRHPSGLRMTFLGVYGPEHALVGHFWPRSDPTAQPSPGAPTTGRRENSAAFYESTYQKLNRSGMLEPLLSGAFRGAFDRLDWELSWLDAVERLVPRLDPTSSCCDAYTLLHAYATPPVGLPALWARVKALADRVDATSAAAVVWLDSDAFFADRDWCPDFGAANASVSAIFSADPPPWRKPVNIGFFALWPDHPFVFYVPFNASGAFDAPVWGRVNASYGAPLVAVPSPPGIR
ncbi:cupin-like domain-containing protein [Aureococcus anophagefferens]|nr:cupin-like domain-containing protein [Aureococcus anophagefferens]